MIGRQAVRFRRDRCPARSTVRHAPGASVSRRGRMAETIRFAGFDVGSVIPNTSTDIDRV